MSPEFVFSSHLIVNIVPKFQIFINSSIEILLNKLITIQQTINVSPHPDVEAATWVLGNFASALAFSPASQTLYSARIEGNVLTALCFRNGPIENAHADSKSLSEKDMKEINIWSSRAMTGVLALKEIFAVVEAEDRQLWESCIVAYHDKYCSKWETTHEIPVDLDENIADLEEAAE